MGYLPEIESYLSAASAALLRTDLPTIDEVIQRIRAAADDEATVFTAGNGGSAATALHFANDLIAHRGRARSVNSVCLSANSSILTALANDLGYDRIFSEQLRHARSNRDLAVVFSVSGSSSNLLKAVEFARGKKVDVIAFVGRNGRSLVSASSLAVVVDHDDFGIVESTHLSLCHVIARLV